MSVLLVRTPDESYAVPFLQNSSDEVVIDATGDFTGHADHVVITGIAAEPTALRAAIDAASSIASGVVDIGPLVGAPSGDRESWTVSLIGLRLVEVSTDSGVPVARVEIDPKAVDVDAALVLGALLALPQSTVQPPVAAQVAPQFAAPKNNLAAEKNPAPRESLPKRVVNLVRNRLKLFGALVVFGLVAVAISAAAYAAAGGYYLAVLLTALIGITGLSSYRSEMQHRRLLGGDYAFQKKLEKRTTLHMSRLARSMGVVELTMADIQHMLARLREDNK